MSPLRAALRDYLRIRRSLGFKLESDERLLEDFIGFLEQAGVTRITTEQALCWAKLPRNARPYQWRKRLGVVRLFARYLATIDPGTEIPSTDLLPATRQRLAPYIYSQTEIAALMSAGAGAETAIARGDVRDVDRAACRDRPQARRGAFTRSQTRRSRRRGAACLRQAGKAARGAAAPQCGRGAGQILRRA